MGLRLELPLTEGGQKTPTGKKNLFYSYGGNENSAAAPAGRAATSPMPAAPAWGQAGAAPPASRPCRRRGAGPGPGGPGDHHTASAEPQGGRARLGPAPAWARSAAGPVSGSGTRRQGPVPMSGPSCPSRTPVLEVCGCAILHHADPFLPLPALLPPLLPSAGAALPCPTCLPLPPASTVSPSTLLVDPRQPKRKHHTLSWQLSSSEQRKGSGAGVFLPGSLIIPRTVQGCSP